MVNGVVDSITSKEVEFNNKGRSFRSVNLERGNIEPSQHFKDLYLHELLPLSPQLVPTGAGELGGAVRDLLTLQAGRNIFVIFQNKNLRNKEQNSPENGRNTNVKNIKRTGK